MRPAVVAWYDGDAYPKAPDFTIFASIFVPLIALPARTVAAQPPPPPPPPPPPLTASTHAVEPADPRSKPPYLALTAERA